jgi:hypothetical protein
LRRHGRAVRDERRAEYWDDNTPSKGREAFSQPFFAFLVESKNDSRPYDPQKVVGLGMLWSTGYIKTVQALYCPAIPDDPGYGYNAFSHVNGLPWPQAVGVLNYYVSYGYNPYYTMGYVNGLSTSATNYVQETAWPSLKFFPATKLLATDLIDNAGDVSHRIGNAQPTWNCLFIDGHVVSAISPLVQKQMVVQGNAGGNWTAFENYRDILEAQANGFDVASASPQTARVLHTSPDTVPGGTTVYHP